MKASLGHRRGRRYTPYNIVELPCVSDISAESADDAPFAQILFPEALVNRARLSLDEPSQLTHGNVAALGGLEDERAASPSIYSEDSWTDFKSDNSSGHLASTPWRGGHALRSGGHLPELSLHTRSPAVDWSSIIDPAPKGSQNRVNGIGIGTALLDPFRVDALPREGNRSLEPISRLPRKIASPSKSKPIPIPDDDSFDLPYDPMAAYEYLPALSLYDIEALPPDTPEEWEKPPFSCEEMGEKVRQKKLGAVPSVY